MANRSDRRGEHADSSLGHSMAVTTIGAPRANIHHGPEPEHSSTNRHFSPMGPEKAALFGIKRFE